MLRRGPRNDQLRPLGQGVVPTLREVLFDGHLVADLREHGRQLWGSNRRLVQIGAWCRERMPKDAAALATQRGVAGIGLASGALRGRVRRLWGASLPRCGLSLGAALGAIRQDRSCENRAAS